MITISIPRHLLISANSRLHYMEKANRIRILRQQAFWIARASKTAPMERAHLAITVHWPKLKRDRDRLNLAPSIKAAVDGIAVDAGILPDDNDTRILSETLTTGAPCGDEYGAVIDLDFRPVAEAAA